MLHHVLLLGKLHTTYGIRVRNGMSGPRYMPLIVHIWTTSHSHFTQHISGAKETKRKE